MEERNIQNLISVNKEDDIVDIVDKIRESEEAKLTLLIPVGAVVLQDVINLKILQKKAEEFGKEVSISRVEEGSARFAVSEDAVVSNIQREDVTVDTQPDNKTKISRSRNILHSKSGKRVSDIIRRGGVVDLRKVNTHKGHEDENATDLSDVRDKDIRESNGASESRSVIKEENLGNDKVGIAEKEDVFAREFSQEKENIDRRENNPFWKELHSSAPVEEKETVVEEKEEMRGFFEKNDRRKDISIGNEEGLHSISSEKPKKKKRGSILPSLSARFFAIFILFCILTASLSLYFILPKADIAVALKRESVEGEFDFLLGVDSDPDEANVIPVEKTEIVSEEKQIFIAESKKQVSEKATGEIIIYNECSTGSQTLVASTRFMATDSGKIFQIEEGVVIPGFSKPEDETIPGEIRVSVVAEGVGESYNIGASSFTIPKLQELGSWKYSCLYAKSQGEMSGGMDKEVTYVAESDYKKAADSLANLAKADIEKRLLERGDGTIIFNDENSEDIVSSSSSVEVGGMAEEFEVTTTVKREVYSVDKAVLETVLSGKIKESANSDSAEAVSDSLVYEIGDVFEKNGDYFVKISILQDFVFNISEDKLRKDVAGKNEQELGEYFGNMSGVKSVDINLWPFWVKEVPESPDKINITVDINDSI
ncbi:MAG: hypothetical protein PHI66_01350 [Candidatus Pacebacteria bacterium]|nr:hypothetical protein [Candidatus Paceibacterota bacterium]